MTDTLFDEKDVKPLIDPAKNYLEELVGDNKKFKSPEELARGKVQSDLYISDLERQLDEMREDFVRTKDEYNAREKLQDLIDRLEKGKNEDTSSDKNLNAKGPDTKTPKDDTDISTVVAAELAKAEKLRKEQDNMRTVLDKLKEHYGPSYVEKFREQTEALGLTKDFVDSLAKTNPNVLFKTFELDTTKIPEKFEAPLRSNRRTDNFSNANSAPQEHTWSYYEKMRKEKPELYHNPKNIAQMHKDRVTLGDKFKDGDYVSFA